MHIYFSDLRRVLTHSKIDKIWIIFFTAHKMFANFNWSKPHKMLGKYYWTHRNCDGRSRMTKFRVDLVRYNRWWPHLFGRGNAAVLWFLVAIEPNSAYYFLCPVMFSGFILTLRALFCSSKTNFIHPYVFFSIHYPYGNFVALCTIFFQISRIM